MGQCSRVRILLTNESLHARGGSQMYVRDVACALAARGMQPLVYSPHWGGVADELRAAAIPVVDRLERLAEPPDVIHGQHHLPTMAAMLRFPNAPAIFVCHGWLPWVERPPRFGRILRYVAVDRLRRERLVSEEGIAPGRVVVVRNFVDLERFLLRQQPLPERPRRALIFGNQAREGSGYAAVVREACAAEGLEVDVFGHANGTAVDRPEDHLGAYDIVFARGRCALEAMATGAAVVLCDVEGLGPLVRREEVEALADYNFGIATLRGRHHSDELRREIRRFDAADAAAVSGWVRQEAGLDVTVERLASLYREVRDEWAARRGHEVDERPEAALYLQELGLILVGHQQEIVRQRQELVRHEQELLRQQQERIRHEEELTQQQQALRGELDGIHATAAFRLRAWLLRHPVWCGLYRGLRWPRRPRKA
jgi:hypothetical protein